MYPERPSQTIGVCLRLSAQEVEDLKAYVRSKPRVPVMLRTPNDERVLAALAQARARRQRRAKHD